MRVARIQWPDDMTDEELAGARLLEDRVRWIVGGLPTHRADSNAQAAFDALDGDLELSGKWRLVTDSENVIENGIAFAGVRVRFTWTRYELEARQSARKAREDSERLEAERAERRRNLGRRRDIVIPVAPGQSIEAGDLVSVNANRQAVRAGDIAITASSYGETLTVSKADLEASGNLDLTGAMFAEIDRLARSGLALDEDQIRSEFGLTNPHAARGDEIGASPVPAYRPPPPLPAERTARVVAIRISSIDHSEAIATLESGEQLLVRDVGSQGVAVGDTVRVCPDGCVRPHRRIGITATPRAGQTLRAAMSHVSDSLAHSFNGTATAVANRVVDAGAHPFARLIANQVRATFDEVLRGFVCRSRDSSSTGPESAAGNDEAALERLIVTREPGDKFYFVKGTPPLGELVSTISFQHAPPAPGSLEARLVEARERRERDGLLRMVQILIVALRAKGRAYEVAGVFYAFLEACLRPWAANPSPLELDIDYKPFGIDFTPAEDPTAARFALLEIEVDKCRS